MDTRFVEYVEPSEFPTLLGRKDARIMANFRLTDSNVTLANTIRRVILSHTYSVGFRTEPYEKSDVEILTNTTPLVNEMIAHRVGMIPICADPLTFDPSLYEFHLDMENTTKEMMDVRASDFKVYRKNPENSLGNQVVVRTEEFFPPDPITGETVLITRLRPQWNPAAMNECLKLRAKASISNGKENIRWSPVTQVSYEYTPNTNPDHIQEVFVNWLLANKKIGDVDLLPTDKRKELEREFATMEIQRCYKRNEKNDPNDFTFHIESVGILSVPDIVRAGLKQCEALVAKYKDVETILNSNVVVQIGDSRFPSVDIVFQEEDHTLGNLLETYIVENHIDGVETPRVQYCGYKVPHPLRKEMFVRLDTRTSEEKEGNVVVPNEMLINRAKAVVSNVCRILLSEFQSLSQEWLKRK